ncbi:hypothetical protein U3516DRAFT_627533 [Neocallimastix sp. 'constans']
MTNEFKIKNMNFNELLEKGWFEIESKPKSFKEDLMVEVEDKKRKTSNPAIKVIIDQSVYNMLLSQALSDKYNSVLGYLGGSFICIPNNNSNNITNISNSSSSSLNKKEEINVCHITHYISSEREIGDLISNNINEVKTSFSDAIQYFESKKVSCVGWYKSTRINKPLLPTFNDIAKQTRLQQLIPNGVGILLSTNHFNYDLKEQSSLLDNLKSMIIYQTYLKDPKNDITLKLFDNDKKIDITSINENPFKRLLFHKNLKYYCVPFGIANQLYPNVDSLENNQKSLLNSLRESRQAYMGQALDSKSRMGQKMFIDAEYESFLMNYWKNSVLNTGHLIDQSYKNLSIKKFQLKKIINSKLNTLYHMNYKNKNDISAQHKFHIIENINKEIKRVIILLIIYYYYCFIFHNIYINIDDDKKKKKKKKYNL